LVYNLDESGFQKKVDAHAAVVIVPSDYPEDETDVPFSRSSKRAMILAGSKANGDCLRPLVIIQRKTIEQELSELGYTPDQCIIVWREVGFITHALFEQWRRDVLFPDLNATRPKLGFPGESHVILDECTAHALGAFLGECTYQGAVPHFLPPHMSDQTQALDLGVFALQKAEASQIRPGPELNPQTCQIGKCAVDSTRQPDWRM
jgi:hypothetical protein